MSAGSFPEISLCGESRDSYPQSDAGASTFSEDSVIPYTLGEWGVGGKLSSVLVLHGETGPSTGSSLHSGTQNVGDDTADTVSLVTTS